MTIPPATTGQLTTSILQRIDNDVDLATDVRILLERLTTKSAKMYGAQAEVAAALLAYEKVSVTE